MDRAYTVFEMLAVVRRRLRLMAATAAMVIAGAAVVIAALPTEYRVGAVVLAEPNRPHADLITPAVTWTVEDRVKSVRQQLLARSTLERVITELDLYQRDRARHGADAAVALLRRHLEINADGEGVFSVYFTFDNPQQAARVVNRLAAIFIEDNLALRERQASRTKSIVSVALSEMRDQVEQTERRIDAFKRAHATELPEAVEGNLRELDRHNKLVEIAETFRREAEHRRAMIGVGEPGHDTEVGRLTALRETAVANVRALSAQYTDDFPDVAAARREMAAIEASLTSARARAAQDDLELRRMNSEVRKSEDDIVNHQKQMGFIQAHVDAAPKWGASLSVLTREQEVLRAKYGQLLSKQVEAEVALELERKSDAASYRLIDAAKVPDAPSGPDRAHDFTLAFLAALVLAGVVAFAVDARDTSLRSSGEAAAAARLPVLALVPSMDHVVARGPSGS